MTMASSTWFFNQANALLRKNVTFQKRNLKTNLGLVAFPAVLCLIIAVLQGVTNHVMNKDNAKPLNCSTIGNNINSDHGQYSNCPINHPPEWPALVQLPGLADATTVLMTGANQSLGSSVGENLFPKGFNFNNSSVNLDDFANFVVGSEKGSGTDNFIEAAFDDDDDGVSLDIIQGQCQANITSIVNVKVPNINSPIETELRCMTGLYSWRKSSDMINAELLKTYQQGRPITDEKTDEQGKPKKKDDKIMAAYDLLNSDEKNFEVNIWYNQMAKEDNDGLNRVPRLVNMVSNAYLQLFRDADTKILIDYVKETPRPFAVKSIIDFSSELGPLFFTWVILSLFPVILKNLVYEKQQNLRIIMKMHGLRDGPYWMITYAYFLFLSLAYMLCFFLFGYLTKLRFFTLNDYGIQFVFYFLFVNLQIAFAFLAAIFFSKERTASVIGYFYLFGSGLVGQFLLKSFIESQSFSGGSIVLLEIIPGLSLYRGIYELAMFSTYGMKWKDVTDGRTVMKEVFAMMCIEWLIFLLVAYYLDQVVSVGSGVRKHPLFFLQGSKKFQKKALPPAQSQSSQDSKVLVGMDQPDVSQEREKVTELQLEPNANYPIICDDMKKIYPGKDGNPPKFAVKGLSLALPPGECFGMLGPNGAGKTSFISMMIGFLPPTSGTAYVHGMDIGTDMDKIYTSMGVCPQHDLLWETLTGREHLLFYGRLKNLKGSALTQAVEDALKSVNLFNGGAGDKKAGTYSGGMKRRLSVAISLIGDPKVVYMDEPTTGLDPASRRQLWKSVKEAKKKSAIILTTHSMEEAEALCDRVGIFVAGNFRCIGNSAELKSRYGQTFVFTISTSPAHEEEVEILAHHLSPRAKKIYHLSGTQKFELPKNEVSIADVFSAVQDAKRQFTIHAWGLADTTLEDVFIKIASDDAN